MARAPARDYEAPRADVARLNYSKRGAPQMQASHSWRSRLQPVVAGGVFVFTLTCRIRGITREFWLLGDQIRDWGIALRPFHELPLVGPPTHVHGYTIGPAYYWLMWAIRVTVGPWFDNLPHSGGIGQAIVESFADAVLFCAVWYRTRSVWLALATILAIATAAYDVALSAIVWTTVIASAFGKLAVALVLLGWHRASVARLAVVAALAWSAVHVYSGAIFVTAGVFGALVSEPLVRRDWRAAGRAAATIALVVGALQVPYLVYQIQTRASDPAMGAVTGSLSRIVTGRDAPEVAKSLNGFASAFQFIQGFPWTIGWAPWLLLAADIVVAIRYRRDVALLMLVLAPQAAAIVGYALFLGALDHYYYIPVVPLAVVAIALAMTLPERPMVNHTIGIVLLLAIATVVPTRLRMAGRLHRMPEYAALVRGSRRIAGMGQPMRAVRTAFPLQPTSDPEFLYKILGGRIDRNATWVATIAGDGQVSYRQITE